MTRSSKRRLTWWVGGGLVAAALLAVALTPRAQRVEVAKVGRGSLQVTLDEEGMTRVRERFAVSAPVAGRVRRIELEPGDPVLAGETVLAVFRPSDPVPLDARARAEAEAALEAATAALGRARSLREQAASELRYADNDANRTRQLHDEGIVSQDRLDQSDLTLRTRREALGAAEFAVRSAEGDLQAARARLLQASTTREAGGDLTIRSPIDGVVLKRFQESEAVMAAGEPLLEVGDARKLEIVVDYLSSDAVRIRPGDRAVVERWGGEPLEAVVRRVEPSGFTKISALGVEEQRVNVILDLVEEPKEALGDGYRVETRVVVWSSDDAVRVPVGALFRIERDWAVFRVEDGRARLVTVRLGERNSEAAQVLEGLEPDDLVVLHPGDQVANGTRLTFDHEAAGGTDGG